MEAIEKEAVVSMEYVISDDHGQILDSSQKQILHFVYGVGQMLPAVEEQLLNQKVDAEVKFHISAADAYGEYDPSLKFAVGPDVFEDGLEIFEGMMFQRQVDDTDQFARVINIDGDTIIADANHPFAGKSLNWHVVIVGIRPASYQEILNKQPNLSGHPCGEEMASTCDKKDSCQTYCGGK